ncbi:phosphopentomutase [Vibrio aestuarianus]|uniref:Phosphopentomutase n=1 Tax=Vibrio aestuarianus TaxID=28171 RepID=A0ABD7YMG9_9VIBR|nr:phosphopentomutase [Vibrio aestuarianus]WGK86103.1 phosphopentomutase [Vibrio aestuarianus]CAH8194145.1 phosphopentomutase [Vibrio aestuarianus]
MKRAIILVMDSFGIGSTKDAHKYNDEGADTFGHIVEACEVGNADNCDRSGELRIPNLIKLGLANAAWESTGRIHPSICYTNEIYGAYGYSQELSTGKDTPSGHWEMAGVPVLFEWGYFDDIACSFPQELLDRIFSAANISGCLGNCHASGTEILDMYGEEHIRTGKPIFYTSSDSVFQIACHEESYGLDNLLDLCASVRGLLGEYNIGRVIARPFIGNKAGGFKRTGNRRDFSLAPPSKTVLQKLAEEKKGDVISIGKIADIFARQGVTREIKATGIPALFDATLEQLNEMQGESLIFTNFVDFDSEYGHRRDVKGYASALEYFDQRLPELLSSLRQDDILIITADHGCDPTWPGTDHTRECIPVLVYGKGIEPGSLGERATFADIGQSLAAFFGLTKMSYGTSFLS